LNENTTFVSTFDGGKTGFNILTDNISKLSGNLISSSINQKLSYIAYQGTGSAITPYENIFIEKIKQLGIDISNSVTDLSKNAIRATFSDELFKEYNNVQFKAAIPRIQQYLSTNRKDTEKILTDNFYVKGRLGNRFGKGQVLLNGIFAPLFPSRSLGGEDRRKTLKNRQ
jgi:hypothetical protein